MAFAAGIELAMIASLPRPGLADTAKPFVCPTTGGDFVFGLDAGAGTFDPMTPMTNMGRAVAQNIYETLMTRDEANNPILDLAGRVTETPDHLAFIFSLRPGVVFHNGKTLTSADVAASFDRFARAGGRDPVLTGVAGWETRDPATFVIRMTAARPAFIDILSSFDTPIVVMPAEDRAVPAGQLAHPIGTGPFRLAGDGANDQIRLKRFDHYDPNPAFTARTGFGGYKQACLATVTFRILADPSDRAAGLLSGALHAADDLSAGSLPDLERDSTIAILTLPDWRIQIAIPNTSAWPTGNLTFRRAVQAVLDMNEILDAASEGRYSLNVGFQFAGQPDHSDAGRETYNIKDPVLAKQLLSQSGYAGEPVVLLTSKDRPAMYNAALVTQQQLQAAGINARLKVVDTPTAARMAGAADTGWHFFFTGWGIRPAIGPLAVMRLFTGPDAVYRPKDGAGDAALLGAWNDMNTLPAAAERRSAFARMQKIALDNVFALPFGALARLQGTRGNVKGFVPFRIPRMANVWFAP